MAQGQKQDSRRHPRTDAAKSADETGFKPVAFPPFARR
jgi:hypothetical protein